MAGEITTKTPEVSLENRKEKAGGRVDINRRKDVNNTRIAPDNNVIDFRKRKNYQQSEEKNQAKENPKQINAYMEADKTTEKLKSNDSGNKMRDPDEMRLEDTKEIPLKMEPPIVISFNCLDGMDKEEFSRQLKGQEGGLNSQSVAENMKNRAAFQENGRSGEGNKLQEVAREKAYQDRIASNMEKGMSYSEAKREATEWKKTQAALHNPDQIAGGDPTKVVGTGDSKVNSSIGSQWKSRVKQIENATNEFAKGYSDKELSQIKMNVKLEVK